MSKLTDFIFDKEPPQNIVNYWSTGGVVFSGSEPKAVSGKEYLTGALIADTYKEVLSVSGSGKLNFTGARTLDSTSRALGIKITIDGVVVFEAVTAATGDSGAGPVAIGETTLSSATSSFQGTPPVFYNSSLLIEISSSITETDKVSAVIGYEVY